MSDDDEDRDERRDDTFLQHVASLRDDAKEYLDEQSEARTRAQEYYRGEVRDMPSDEGTSKVVSRDVRAIIRKVMPSITRTILSNDQIVEYEPVGPEDEDYAQQATEYVNTVVVPESLAEQGIYDAIFDALLVKTGILKWHAYKHRTVRVHSYSDQSDDQVLGVIDDDDNEILDHKKTAETDKQLLAVNPNARRHTFKVKREHEETCIRLEAVPRERFLITPGADDIATAELVGEEQRIRRCDLVAMGYDKAMVWKLSSNNEEDDCDEMARMGDDWTSERQESKKALQEVTIWELYVRHDEDRDGIAELHRIVFGEGKEEDNEEDDYVELGREIVDEAPYAEVVIERDAHQFEGRSTFEDTEDVQQVKTKLIRQTLNNLDATNNPRPVVDYSSVVNPEDVSRTEFGLPIMVKSGRTTADVVTWSSVPFTAEKSFGMLEYWDGVARDRTGITDASAGLEADHIANINNGVAVLMAESGVAQADAIVRSIARGGLRKAFRGLLKLVIAHADGPRTVRIRGEWREYDPRVWNVDMDCRVNVGLGGGTKERDLAVLQLILGLQKDVLASMGPTVGQLFVNAEQLGTTLQKIVETAGFPSADPFFSKPEAQQVQQAITQSQPPDPTKAATEGAIAVEQAKGQTTMQVEAGKAQLAERLALVGAQKDRAKEQAQLEADMQMKQLEIAAEDRRKQQEIAAEDRRFQQELMVKREEIASRERVEVARMAAELDKARLAANTASSLRQREMLNG